jgi:hypothetical protein
MAELTELMGVLSRFSERLERMESGQRRFARKINREQRKLQQDRAPTPEAAAAAGQGRGGSQGAGAEDRVDRPARAERRARRAAETKALEDAISTVLSTLSPEVRDSFQREHAGHTAADRAIAAIKLHGGSSSPSSATGLEPATQAPTAPSSASSTGTVPPLSTAATGGRGPGPAAVPSVRHPRSWAEFYNLTRAERDRLEGDKSFDLESLPSQTRT